MALSRRELGIHTRRVISWGNGGLAVRLSAVPSAASAPLAMAVAIITTSGLTWGSQGVNALDQARILRVETVLGNGIREEVSRCLKVRAVIRVSTDYFHGHLEKGMLDTFQEKADFLAFIIGVT